MPGLRFWHPAWGQYTLIRLPSTLHVAVFPGQNQAKLQSILINHVVLGKVISPDVVKPDSRDRRGYLARI